MQEKNATARHQWIEKFEPGFHWRIQVAIETDDGITPFAERVIHRQGKVPFDVLAVFLVANGSIDQIYRGIGERLAFVGINTLQILVVESLKGVEQEYLSAGQCRIVRKQGGGVATPYAEFGEISLDVLREYLLAVQCNGP